MSAIEGGSVDSPVIGSDPAAVVARVWELLAAGDFDAAEGLLLPLVRDSDDQGPGHHGLLGYVYQQSGKYELAVEACTTALDRGMRDWSNYLMLGSSLKNLGRDEEAHGHLAESWRLAPDRLDAALLLLEVTLAVKGAAAAAELHAVMSRQFADPALQTTWDKLLAAYIPPAVPPLLEAGRIDEAIAQLEAARRGKPSRRVIQWLHYLDRHKQWLAFTDRQRTRSDPDRKPSITILLITYNHGKYIAECLEGILKQQTDCLIEVHAVDDASTDNTQEIILDYQRRYPGFITTHFNPTNVGTLDPPQQKVTHKAFTRLTGDYTCILEGDDYWSDPHKLHKQIGFLEKNPIFTVCAHNTIKIYEDGSIEPHRFLYWPGIKPVQTIDDAASMTMFFHTASVIYRNVLMMQPPAGFANRWSCDIFNTAAHMEYGELRYFDEDMAVYRAHSGGSYSTMPALKSKIMNVEGMVRYNAWLGFRYAKAYAMTINRLTIALLRDTAAGGDLPPLTWIQRLRYRAFRRLSGLAYDLMDRYPRLDPAVWRFNEPPKPSEPRRDKLIAFGVER